MSHLSLVKPVSRLKEELRQTEEVRLEPFGLEFTRGTLTEIVGRTGSGKKSLVLSLLAKLTTAGEICAVVDSCGGFDPCKSKWKDRAQFVICASREATRQTF